MSQLSDLWTSSVCVGSTRSGGPNPDGAQKSNIGLSSENQMWKYPRVIWLAKEKKKRGNETTYFSEELKMHSSKWEKMFELIVARYVVKPWKCLFYVTPLSFTSLSSPQTHKKPAKRLSRLGLALSNGRRLSFIAQTFTILFAMYEPAVWQRLPLYQRDNFGGFYFSP